MKKNAADITLQDTEQMILKAAEKEFLTKGFAGARTTSIAEAAGVTHAMLHYYFRTKSKLFDKVLADKINLLKDALFAPVVEVDMPLSDIIRNVIDKHLDFIAANPELPRFIIEEIYSEPERSHVFLSQLGKYAPMMLGAMQKKIDEAAAKGECRKVDARMLMLDIASLNIFSYLAAPIVNVALEGLTTDTETFLELRKKENFDTIMRKLDRTPQESIVKS